MSNIEAKHISLVTQDMGCLSEEEIVFFFQISALVQEIISLQKWIHMSSHGVPEKWQRAAENAQAMYFLRTLAGTLFEAWDTLQLERYRVVKAKYKQELDSIALDAYSKLTEYFGNSNNLCEKIRNNYSHHYNYGEMRNLIRQWPVGERLDLILAEQYANCRFLAADTLTNFAIIGITEPAAEMKMYFSEVLGVASSFVELGGFYVSEILKLLEREKNINVTNLIIEKTPCLDDVRLHYFVTQ